ncbi:oxidoreductase [Chromobacterium haemolyticum]|uniref:Oxidoreductase n=1 Tax=Chromobacterium haemolyticum TaxID=394935 RepID=A0ABS3GQH7_9NEIS|nr:oxidoreductase [Chromobacterium haemolyticum]MBK0415473.1 oxidoreductase [Chromobacterium haemolyticum]MBO0416854.1 oxidoreductase [Chromobacterium haemolyticum]MBO0499958.1 oxidoreductase [Chromobacterium haemolyticum]
MQPLNVALVGYGYAGKTFHAPLISATSELKLAAVVSSRPDEVRADWPQVPVMAGLEQALLDPAIDMLVIASPNRLHYPQARSGLMAGKHVVVDKPFTVTQAEARELCLMAERPGSPLLSVFHNRRWDADFLALKALLAGGELGALSHFESHFNRYRPQVRARWREQDQPGAGLWYDLGPHLLDQALQLLGWPQTIYASLFKQRAGAQATDYFHVQLGYAEYQAVLHGSCLVSGGVPRFSLHGTLASYVKFGLDSQEDYLKRGGRPGEAGWGVDLEPGILFRLRDDGEIREPRPSPLGDYRDFYCEVARAAQGLGPNPVTAREAWRVIALLEQGERSAREGRRLFCLPVA